MNDRSAEELRDGAVRLRHEAEMAPIPAICDILRSLARQYDALADETQAEVGGNRQRLCAAYTPTV